MCVPALWSFLPLSVARSPCRCKTTTAWSDYDLPWLAQARLQMQGGGGWSASIALTFTTEIHHSWRRQMRRSCQFGVSHSAMPEMSHSIKCLPTCCLPNDTEKSFLARYHKSKWFKATNLSYCQVLHERVHHCNLCIAVIKSSSVSRDELPLWSGTLMRLGQAFGELFVYPRYWFSPPLPPPSPRWPLNQICPRLRFMMKTSKDH